MATQEEGLKVEFNLFALRRQLELLKGERVNWTDVAEITGLHHNTLYNLSENRTRRVDLETLEKLLIYFQASGLQIQIGDLFMVSRRPLVNDLKE